MTERARAVSGLCQPELSDRSLRAPNYGEQIPELWGNPPLRPGGGTAKLSSFQVQLPPGACSP